MLICCQLSNLVFVLFFSVSDQLLLVYGYVSVQMDLGSDVDVLYFDYHKAFDVVNQALLVTKLSLIGIGNPLLGWIKDFLTGREMKVQWTLSC